MIIYMKNGIEITKEEADEIALNFLMRQLEKGEHILDLAISEFCQAWRLSSDCQSELKEVCEAQMIGFASVSIKNALIGNEVAKQEMESQLIS